jgi:hypothetical protein
VILRVRDDSLALATLRLRVLAERFRASVGTPEHATLYGCKAHFNKQQKNGSDGRLR